MILISIEPKTPLICHCTQLVGSILVRIADFDLFIFIYGYKSTVNVLPDRRICHLHVIDLDDMAYVLMQETV